MTEIEIENIVIKNATKLGYRSGFAVIRNVRIGPEQGRVDLAIFPRSGKKKVILVEVKRSDAEEAKCKVVGQIIMYLTGALQLSEEGVDLYRNFARNLKGDARSPMRISPGKIAKGLSGKKAPSAQDAWKILCAGTPLKRDQIALYIATDGPPKPQVNLSAKLLADHHDLQIGLIEATKGGIKVHRKCP